jgi:SAM-dependent MidA family methyltransferase
MSGNPLRERIVAEIHRCGPIPFSRYMEMCLYEPELGYYARPREQFGKAGDFYTASDVHAVFGRLLSRQFEEMWRVLGSPERIELIELGPGRGLFAADVLDWSAKQFPEFARALHYVLVEQSVHLRARLQERLAEHIAAGRTQMLSLLETSSDAVDPSGVALFRDGAWASDEPARQGRGDDSPARSRRRSAGSEREIVPSPSATAQAPPRTNQPSTRKQEEPPFILFANEFFDALPVEIIDHRGAVRVAEEHGRFIEQFVSPSANELDYIDHYSVHPEEGERVEVSLAALNWMDHIAKLFGERRGFAMFIDYGYTREEQLAGRHRDTLITYQRHRASASPYEAPGDQDITAHVNFTALRSRAREQGLGEIGLVTQTQLLLGIGEETQFADAFQECKLPQERAKVALQLRHLLSPEEMGEKFHALLLVRGVPHEEARRLSAMKLLAT